MSQKMSQHEIAISKHLTQTGQKKNTDIGNILDRKKDWSTFKMRRKRSKEDW